jgi:uncharacterized protein YegL
MCKKSIHLTYFVLMMVFFLTSSVHAYTIVWVSDWTTGTGQPAQWDKGWSDLLAPQGYTVNNTSGQYWRTLDATKLATLDAADLIIISRDGSSGEYDDGSEPSQWNSVKTPLILLSVYIARSSIWRWFDTTTLTADGDAPICGAVLTSHPIFTGVTLDASNQVDVLDETVGTGNTSFVNIANAGNGTVIATRPTASNYVWIAEWSPGQRFYPTAAYTDGTPAVAGARRMLFTAGTREGGSFGQGMYNLTAEGQKMFLNAVNYMITFKQLKAYNPTPADGTKNIKPPSLTWAAGDTAVAHDVYLGTDQAAIEDADTSSPEWKETTASPQFIIITESSPSTTYYWRIDEIEEGGTVHKGDVWNFATPPLKAYNPSPPDGVRWQDPNVNLSWTAGFKAKPLWGQDVYFGTDATAVANANTSNPMGVFKGNQSGLTYDLPTLARETFYYWRIDERNSDNTVTKGDVWLFKTTVPGLGTILRQIWENITPTGTALTLLYNWPLFPDSPTSSDERTSYDSPDHNPDLVQYGGRMHGWLYPPFSGDYTFYLASDDNGELLLSTDDDQANAVQIASVTPYTGYQVWITYPAQKSAPITLDADKRYYISALWKQGTGGDHCSVGWTIPGNTNITVIPGIYLAPYVQYWAFSPKPANNAADVEQKPTLIWKPGIKTLKHNVYFGDDQTAVSNANTSTAVIYKGQFDVNEYPVPTNLNLGQTYYWRIDEVNGLEFWTGKVWNFSVANYLIVDDFERYTNTSPDIIWQTWVAAGGGKVGYNDPNYAQTYIIHGGTQSMPLDYSNLNPPNFSEASRTFAATDFTKYGVKALSLWTRGYPPYMGSFVQAPAGTYTMTAGGEDIWDVPDIRHPSTFHDEFHYAYTQTSGNCIIIAKVESVSNTNAWAKAGVMVRDSIDANSPHAMMCMTPGNGASFQYRLAAGGASTNGGQDPNVDAPYWVAIERQGDMFYGAYSPDGLSWTTLGQMTITMPDPVYIGLSLTGHNAAATCTAVFTNVSINQAPPPQLANQDIGIKSNIAAPLYVTLQDSSLNTATVTNPDPNAVLNPAWQEWGIPLSSFAGVSKNTITKLTVGVGTRSVTTGTIYVDDIRLYLPSCVPALLKPLADFTNDCLVDYADLQIMVRDWLLTDSSVATSPPVDANMVVRYEFEDNLYDSASYAGYQNGDPCGSITYDTGAVGNRALSLGGGTCANFSNPTALDFGTTNWSVCAWIKTTQSGTGDANKGSIFGKGGDSTDGIRYALGVGEVTEGRVSLTTDDNVTKVQATSTTTINNNVWHQVVGLRDGAALRLYVNGMLEATTTLPAGYNISGTSQHNAYAGTITNHSTGSVYKFYQGLIDDVRVYNYALSNAEIAYIATKGAAQMYIPLRSPANIYDAEPPNSKSVNLRDYALLADMWLEELLWPQ